MRARIAQRPVDRRGRLLVRPVVADVADDADHFAPGVRRNSRGCARRSRLAREPQSSRAKFSPMMATRASDGCRSSRSRARRRAACRAPRTSRAPRRGSGAAAESCRRRRRGRWRRSDPATVAGHRQPVHEADRRDAGEARQPVGDGLLHHPQRGVVGATARGSTRRSVCSEAGLRKPGWTWRIDWKVRIINPEPIRRTSARATWTIVSVLRVTLRSRPALELRPPPRSVPATAPLPCLSTGMAPKAVRRPTRGRA